MRIEVLDHGFVRLVSYTQPVDHNSEFSPKPNWTGDLEIVRAARTSYNADWRVGDKGEEASDRKLINYLMMHDHTTPFEAMVLTFEVQAPLFVLRQWHRHRTWSYNEVSARYTELPEMYYVPEAKDIKPQSRKNKQGRDGEFSLTEQLSVKDAIDAHSKEAFRIYQGLIENEVARELARMVLPLNTYSRMFATVDLHNLFHFLKLRLDEHAQFEIREYARALLVLIRSIVPVAVEAFEAYIDLENE